jgi:hypothetical protein
MWIAASSECGRWPEILCGRKGIGYDTSEKPRAPIDADSQDWAPRLRALEQMVGEPAILGSGDGLANQVDRLKAVGNGQVPAVVKLAWETLKP